MGVVVRLHSSRYRLFLKGTLEILTKKCARHIIVSKNPDHSQHADSDIETLISRCVSALRPRPILKLALFWLRVETNFVAEISTHIFGYSDSNLRSDLDCFCVHV